LIVAWKDIRSVPSGSEAPQLPSPFASRQPSNSSVPVNVRTPDGVKTPYSIERVYQ
jgi:hypothetical protein